MADKGEGGKGRQRHTHWLTGQVHRVLPGVALLRVLIGGAAGDQPHVAELRAQVPVRQEDMPLQEESSQNTGRWEKKSSDTHTHTKTVMGQGDMSLQNV
jgi:hypothetical protein